MSSYQTEKGHETCLQVMEQLKEAFSKKRSLRAAKGSRTSQPMENISREFHRALKETNLSLIIYRTLFCKSNTLIVDECLFVSTPCPWLDRKSTRLKSSH